jgi:hypothetical protein
VLDALERWLEERCTHAAFEEALPRILPLVDLYLYDSSKTDVSASKDKEGGWGAPVSQVSA